MSNTVPDCSLSMSENSNSKSNDIDIHVDITDIKSIEKAEKTLKNLKMNYEVKRLETFYNWPLQFISVLELAKNGFYFTGKGDLVKCNYCHVTMGHWTGSDNIESEHKRHSPRCSFINGNVFNIPIEKPKPNYYVPNKNLGFF